MNFQETVSNEFIDLLSKIFKFMPEERLSAKEILEEPFFTQQRNGGLKGVEVEEAEEDHLRTTDRSNPEQIWKDQAQS